MVNRNPAPPQNPWFSQRQPAMQDHPGRPLEPQQVENIRRGNAAGPRQDREVPSHGNSRQSPPRRRMIQSRTASTTGGRALVSLKMKGPRDRAFFVSVFYPECNKIPIVPKMFVADYSAMASITTGEGVSLPNSPSQRATTAVARQLPRTLVAVRAMSMS